MIEDDFDQTDIKNMGRPIFWRLDKHIEVIESFIRADELKIALRMCDDVPGWFRDNYPRELTAIKLKLYEQCYDQIEYATDDEEANCTREFGESQWDNGYMFPRAQIMADLIKSHINPPWIFDLGCSHGNLPLGLLKEGLKFTYLGKGMNWRIQEKVKNWLGPDVWQEKPQAGQNTILYCTEVLEHCFNPHDLVHSAYKIGIEFNSIVLSTPYGTLGGGLPNWRTRRIGHVRTWTATEFYTFATKSFPGYNWKLTMSPSMVLVGWRG